MAALAPIARTQKKNRSILAIIAIWCILYEK
jgi:hypothetical protein